MAFYFICIPDLKEIVANFPYAFLVTLCTRFLAVG